MAICLLDGEVFCGEKDKLERSDLLIFFLNDHRESVVAVYEEGKYQGFIVYQSLLRNSSIDSALIKEKVYLDEKVWLNISNILHQYSYIDKIPVLAKDDTILYIAENNLKWTNLMFKLSSLMVDNDIWKNVSAVCIKGANEALFYLKHFLERKGVQVFVEGEVWEMLGIHSENSGSENLQVITENGEWIDNLYSELEVTRRGIWGRDDWNAFCKDLKAKGAAVIFCGTADSISEKMYDAFLQEGINPEAIFCLDNFDILFGEKINVISELSESLVWCLVGVWDDVRINMMFESIVRNQKGYFENVYVLSRIGNDLPDIMLFRMIHQCGKVVLMGDERLCGLFEKQYSYINNLELAYVKDREQMEMSGDKYVDALWFYLGIPSERTWNQYKKDFAMCMEKRIYLSRYFLDYYNLYTEENYEDCFTKDELAEMTCLKQLQLIIDECNIDKFAENNSRRNVLFLAPELSYMWDGIAPLFKYYAKKEDVKCTVLFHAVYEIVERGVRNIKETIHNIYEIRRQGGNVFLYDNWLPDKEYDICYMCLGFSYWDYNGIDMNIRKRCKWIILLQTTAFHTHYYIGNNTFEDMFRERHKEEIDYIVVSKFMADWVVQRGEEWRNKLLSCGYPRMDCLYEDFNSIHQIPDEWQRIVEGKKVIYFTAFNTNLFDICYEYCKKDIVVLIWRPHPYDFGTTRQQDRIEDWKKRKNVIIDTNQSYSMAFGVSDALITTFSSSVLVNYLFTEKPILILDKDFLNIKDNRIDYREEAWYKAAYIANKMEDYRDFIDMIVNGRDDKKKEKLPYRRFMQQGFDGKVCKRIAKIIDEKLEEMI